MRAALYIRKSTPGEKMQADSHEVQEQVLRAYADRRGICVVRVYRDSASGTTVAERPGFMQLVRAVTGRHDFEAVLVRDVTRFGRFMDPDESAYWSYLFELHGVKTIYVEEMFSEDESPLAGLVKTARRVMAAEFSREKSRMVTASQERVTSLGFHRGGPAPYGMKRILVTARGEFVDDLERGVWKSLSPYRTKLAPGDPGEVAIVREIFTAFAAGASTTTISGDLNRRGVRAPRGGRWWEASVSGILRNPAYVGAAVFTRRQACLRPSDHGARRTERPGSYEPIINAETWQAVRSRQDALTLRRTDEELAAALRTGYEACGSISRRVIAPFLRCSWDTYRNRFKEGLDGALVLAYRDELEQFRSQIEDLLKECADYKKLENWEYEIEAATRLVVTFAFARRWQRGRGWRFRPAAGALTLAVALSASPLRIEAIFLARVRGRTSTMSYPASWISRHAFYPGDTKNRRRRFRLLVFGTNDAEKRFLTTARSQPLINLSSLARELGWPRHVVTRMYKRLLRRGCYLPPRKYVTGRRIKLVCSRCGEERLVQPNRALQRRSTLCWQCSITKPNHKLSTRCPRCGRARQVWPSELAKLSQGEATVCKTCRVSVLRADSLNRRRAATERPPEA